ncbi:MAG TPA: XdhC/CoxI family protein, partial [Thermoanaerobaculia bacterium]
MRADLLALAAELSRREEPYVLAVVTWRRPPSSAQAGDTALVTADAFHGWLGGACTRPTVEREARAALADGRPRLVVLDPEPGAEERRPGVEVRPMTCHSGGSVEIYLDPVLPAPRLVVYGESPAARALAAIGGTLGYTVTAVDSPGAEAPAGGAPAPVTTIGTSGAPGAAPAHAGGPPHRRPLYAVVATMGEADEESIRAALELRPDYLGLVASERRFAEIRRTLAAAGVDEQALDAVRSPAGLSIGARTPEEIALAVLAEVVQLRPAAQAAAGEAAAEAPAAPATAVDPICGMTVEIAGARHTAEHAGR